MTGVRHHFGAWLCAYVDGELTGPQASRVHSHLATCAACSAEVAAQLDARQIVAAARVEPAPDLADRILASLDAVMVPLVAQQKAFHDLRDSEASADQQVMTNQFDLALRSAREAEAGLPQGSPDWLRAQDIALEARAMLERIKESGGDKRR